MRRPVAYTTTARAAICTTVSASGCPSGPNRVRRSPSTRARSVREEQVQEDDAAGHAEQPHEDGHADLPLLLLLLGGRVLVLRGRLDRVHEEVSGAARRASAGSSV